MEGLRGETPRDREALAAVIRKYSQLVANLGDEIAESDANPSQVYWAARASRSSTR
jgi:acetate---CoA ligase (ADP-forming)